MIAEMLTRVPGPRSQEVDPNKIIWSERLEKTNIWDLDGNRFIDLTSGGGLLPFGYVDEGVAMLDQVVADFKRYRASYLSVGFFDDKKIMRVGAKIESAFSAPLQDPYLSLAELAQHEGQGIDLLVVQAEYIEPTALKNIASWCKQFGVSWIADERDLGMFRTGEPFVSANYEPDFILASIAGEKMSGVELLYTRPELKAEDTKYTDSPIIQVAQNYIDSDLTRTIRLQSLELSGLLKDTILDKEIGCVGAFHSIELSSVEEVVRVSDGLLQRGIIVASMGSKLILLPSLYLALGEIVFVVNHIKLVIANINEMATPWMTEDLRS